MYDLSNNLQVVAYLKKLISNNGGYINFAKFMQAALYAPNIGYYNNPACIKFGQNGDFITAPMLGELFATAIYKQCTKLFNSGSIKAANILEIGAGNGLLACQLLKKMSTKLNLQNYLIFEISPALRKIQQDFLLHNSGLNSKLCAKISWLECLPVNFDGVILANEVLDAFPVDLFILKDQQIKEKVVIYQNNNFAFIDIPANHILTNYIARLPLDPKNYIGHNFYTSEICWEIPKWLTDLNKILASGSILLCDYGFLVHEYYHPERKVGTLMAHYQHCTQLSPLLRVGLQDLTSHVDFSLVMDSAMNNGLQVELFCSLANFLMAHNIQASWLKNMQNATVKIQYKLYQELNTLLAPNEMGEIFKILILTKNPYIHKLSFAKSQLQA